MQCLHRAGVRQGVLGLQQDPLQPGRQDQPAVLLLLGHRGGGVAQTPLPAYGKMDRKAPCRGRQASDLGADRFHVLQRGRILRGTGAARPEKQRRGSHQWLAEMLITPEFEIIVSGVDESLKEGLTPEQQTERLAYIKAKDVFEKTSGDRIVIGSDTIVTKKGKIYGKPKSRENAIQMIKELLEGDRTHSVITGLSILIEKDGVYKEYKTFDEVKVFLKEMSEQEIEKWVDSGKAMDKAGAYGIQNEFCVFVDKIDGNYTSIVGLPTQKVYDVLKNYID